MWHTSTAGNSTVRSASVRSRVRLLVSIACRPASIRRSCSRSASTVRAPATVAVSTSASADAAAPSAR
jgi:hypothetical protein